MKPYVINICFILAAACILFSCKYIGRPASTVAPLPDRSIRHRKVTGDFASAGRQAKSGPRDLRVTVHQGSGQAQNRRLQQTMGSLLQSLLFSGHLQRQKAFLLQKWYRLPGGNSERSRLEAFCRCCESDRTSFLRSLNYCCELSAEQVHLRKVEKIQTCRVSVCRSPV